MRQSVLLPLAILSALFAIRPFVSYFALLELPSGQGVAIVTGCAIALWIHALYHTISPGMFYFTKLIIGLIIQKWFCG